MASDPIFVLFLPAALADALDALSGEESDPNLTALVVEFAGCLNPLAAARTTAERQLGGPTWRPCGHSAASGSIVRLTREMAQDPRLVRMIGVRYPQALEGSALKEAALPMLLGLAAVTALRLRVGIKARALAARLPDGVLRSERQRSDDGTPSGSQTFKSPLLGALRPELAPIPKDLASPSQ